jgi:hypothetical protein
MSKLNSTQQSAVNAYASFLDAGVSYGDAMRKAAQSLGGTPCPTFLGELAKVHARRYECSYTWDGQGRAVFFDGEESTRETRNDAARKSWSRNVMVWFTPEREAAPKASTRVSREARAAAKALIELCGSVAAAKAALAAV